MFEHYKIQIAEFLTEFLNKKQIELKEINPYGADIISKLIPYLLNGKMFRGSLALLTEDKLGKPSTSGLIIASSLELIQAAILIHDDIIDEDDTRRGMKSIHAQYQEYGKSLNIVKNKHFGNSLAICGGDITFFLAFELMNNLDIEPISKQKILSIFSQELQTVGLSEMQDVVFGNRDEIPTEKEILNLYRTKTGRYSFSLSLMLGAILTDQPQNVISALEKFGETIGIIYQIKDDELSLFGDSKVTGKPVGTDISRANKTLYYLYLLELSSPQEKKLLQEIFGKPNLKLTEIEYVRNLVKSLSIDQKINQQITNLNTDALNILDNLKLQEEFKSELKSLLNIFQNRKK